MTTHRLQEAARKALGRAESGQRAAVGTFDVYLPWAYEFVGRVGAAVPALAAEARPSQRPKTGALFTPDEMKEGAELYAKTRASITAGRAKPGYTPPPVPVDLQDAVEQAGMGWYGLDPEDIANRLPPFPKATGVSFPKERRNPVPLIKGEKGPIYYYGGSSAAMALAWQEFAPEGFPPQPNRGSTYSKAESDGIESYVANLWPPEIQFRRFAKAVDQYLKAHLPERQYGRTVGDYAGREVDYSPAYFARSRYYNDKIMSPAGKGPEYVATEVRKRADELAERYTYLVALLQPGLLEDYTGHPELIDRQYEIIKNTPYAHGIRRRLLDFYLPGYSKIKLKDHWREEKADYLVEMDKLKISEALTLIAQADKARAAEQEAYDRKKSQGLRLVYSTLRKYDKPPRLQTLLDAHPALKSEVRQGSIRFYYKAPGDTDLTLLLYHDGNQTALMEKLWQEAQRKAE